MSVAKYIIGMIIGMTSKDISCPHDFFATPPSSAASAESIGKELNNLAFLAKGNEWVDGWVGKGVKVGDMRTQPIWLAWT